MQLDLRVADSFDDIVAQVEAAVAVAEPGQWIFGRGWHQEKWSTTPEPNVSGLPYHDALSEVSPDNPVYLTHASGHAALVNALALELGGVDDETADPPGGEIVRDRKGRAIGVLRETAEELVSEAIDSEWDEATVRRMAELAAEESLANGITSFHDAGSSFQQVELFKKMALAGESSAPALGHALGEQRGPAEAGLPGYRVYREGGDYLTVGGIKRWVDGALGSHGAWMLEPYTDLPESIGLNIVTPDELRESARIGRGTRSPAVFPRHWRSRQQGDARYLPGDHRRPRRRKRNAVAGRTRATPRSRRHSALQGSRRHRSDATCPLHLGWALGAGAPW